MERVCELDKQQAPLCPTSAHSLSFDPLLLLHYNPDESPESRRSEFVALKSYIVLYMLDKRLGKGSFQKVLNAIFTSINARELPNGVSTHHFLRVCRKITGKLSEVKSFSDQWIHGAGVPKFTFVWNFNRRRMMVEFKFRQEKIVDLDADTGTPAEANSDALAKRFTVWIMG